MLAKEFNSMLLGLNHKIEKFNLSTMLTKIKNKELSKEQIQKLKDDVYNLEEYLIMIDCEH